MALDVAGGYAAPDFARRDSGALLDEGTGGHVGAFAYLAAVEQRGNHADEGMIVDGASDDGDVVAILDIGAAPI